MGKFFKLKSIDDAKFYCECVTTSLSIIRANVIEHLAVYYSYKLFEDFADDGNYSHNRIKEIKEMSDDDIMNEAFDYNVVGKSIVLPTIPKIILSNVDEFDERFTEDDYIDITDDVISKIKGSIDVDEIKEFVATHSDEEIVDRYCADERYRDMFWYL